MKRLRRGIVAGILVGALALPLAAAQPIEAGVNSSWRSVLALVEDLVDRALWYLTGAEEVVPEQDPVEEPSPTLESGDETESLSSTNEVHPSFDPDG